MFSLTSNFYLIMHSFIHSLKCFRVFEGQSFCVGSVMFIALGFLEHASINYFGKIWVVLKRTFKCFLEVVLCG